MRTVVVTGMGAVAALGQSAEAIAQALEQGLSGVRLAGDERDGLPVPGLALADVDIRKLLKRRKDRKLMPRAAELALWAAAQALGDQRDPELGLFLGVGREPPDDGETEASLVASQVDGRFDVEAFDGPGRAAYPPLASLRTLPNLQLAHVAINLDITGPGGTRAGAEAAGVAAMVEGWRAVAEGQCDAALVGGADSLVDAGSARDQVRLGWAGPARAPGEAAVVFLIETAERAAARGAPVLATLVDGGEVRRADALAALPHEAQLGSCGAAAGPLAIAIAIARRQAGELALREGTGAGAWLRWDV